MNGYKELSTSQNSFIEAQKARISDLEGQLIPLTAEFTRICQINQKLSAIIERQDMEIRELGCTRAAKIPPNRDYNIPPYVDSLQLFSGGDGETCSQTLAGDK